MCSEMKDTCSEMREIEKPDIANREIDSADITERHEDVSVGCCCGEVRTKERSGDEIKELMNRLSRIEGQVRGVRGMLERGAYCTDIITQVSAINAALNSFNRLLLENHIKTCVTSDIQDGRYASRDELTALIFRLMR